MGRTRIPKRIGLFDLADYARLTAKVALIASIAVVLCMPYSGNSYAQVTGKPPPLIARGLTDAPDGTVIVSGEPTGGHLLIELRIAVRQKVVKGDIIAVLSQYHRADSFLRMVEADLAKLKVTYQAVLKGTRIAEIELQEAAVNSMAEANKLKHLQRMRLSMPTDQKEIEVTLAEQALEQQKAILEIMKTKLANDLAQHEIELANAVARVDSARQTREDTLVRTPIDGIVAQIFTRVGERVSPAGIAKIVDMRQIRILADVDELSIGLIKLGGKVEFTFQGDSAVYNGTVDRIATTVKRMQRSDSVGGTSTDARAVQVNIKPDDPSGLLPVLGREARVTFL